MFLNKRRSVRGKSYMVGEVFDVVLQSTGAFHGVDCPDWQKSLPPEGDFSLEPNLWIGRLPHNILGESVFDACEPMGFNVNSIRQYGYHYALCRKVEPKSADYYSWDSDNHLARIVFLSRLVHPTTMATHHSARLYFQDGELKSIAPGHVQAVQYGTHAWIVASRWRDWLSQPEAMQLKQHIQDYIP